MKKKLLGIFVCMLLIATALPVFGMETDDKVDNTSIEDCSDVISASNDGKNNELDTPPLPRIWWLGVDQKQDSDCRVGLWTFHPIWLAQEFKPTKEKLIGIELHFFPGGSPPPDVELTVSIRDTLNGSDLTATTVSAETIAVGGTWVTFDFPDINVTPGNTYYIVCVGSDGSANNAYCWLFDYDNPYDRGIAWKSEDDGTTWYDLENSYPQYPEIDFCFKTYHSKSKNKPYNMNLLFLRFLEQHPNLFPILRHLLGF